MNADAELSPEYLEHLGRCNAFRRQVALAALPSVMSAVHESGGDRKDVARLTWAIADALLEDETP